MTSILKSKTLSECNNYDYDTNTALGLLGGGCKELISDRISDVFLLVFEGGTCMQAWEGLDRVVEVGVTFIMGNSDVKFFAAHCSTIIIDSREQNYPIT